MPVAVSIITVNYNQKKVTEDFLSSVAAHCAHTPLEIIVVDNASHDNPIPEWHRTYPGVIFIRSEINLGFAGGNNLGIACATGDLLFLVNNDTEFTAGLLERLVAVMTEHPLTGLLSPKIRYFDRPELLQYAGYTAMDYLTARNHCIGQFEVDRGQYDSTGGPTGFIHGAAMMTSKAAIAKAGLMEENYFLYYEEMDWCEKMRRAGLEIRFDPSVFIYHKESVSVGAKSALKEYFMNRNRILFIRRNCIFFTRAVFWLYFLLVVTPRNILSYLKNGHTGFAGVFFRAIMWNITNSVNSKKLGFDLTKGR